MKDDKSTQDYSGLVVIIIAIIFFLLMFAQPIYYLITGDESVVESPSECRTDPYTRELICW